jgi:hypothetical protein
MGTDDTITGGHLDRPMIPFLMFSRRYFKIRNESNSQLDSERFLSETWQRGILVKDVRVDYSNINEKIR